MLHEHASWWRLQLRAFFGALGFFTRLPVPAWVGYSSETLNRSAAFFPLVGLLVGVVGASVYWLASQIWPAMVALLLSMAATIYLTGGFHEDGLADLSDGFGGGWNKAQILAIMKDSRIGSYGVLALWLALTAKFATLLNMAPMLLPFALVAGHVVSRVCATLIIGAMDYVRDEAQSKVKPMVRGLSYGAGVFIAATMFSMLFILPMDKFLAGTLAALLVTVLLARKLQHWLGGYTGDCLGAVQQVSEIAFYLGMLAHFPPA